MSVNGVAQKASKPSAPSLYYIFKEPKINQPNHIIILMHSIEVTKRFVFFAKINFLIVLVISLRAPITLAAIVMLGIKFKLF